MAEPGHTGESIGIGPSPPPVNNMPAHPGGNRPPPQDWKPNPDSDVDNPSALPLRPFQPNWSIGHPLPWNGFRNQQRREEEREGEFPPYILAIDKQG